jgi:hypothetical protein
MSFDLSLIFLHVDFKMSLWQQFLLIEQVQSMLVKLYLRLKQTNIGWEGIFVEESKRSKWMDVILFQTVIFLHLLRILFVVRLKVILIKNYSFSCNTRVITKYDKIKCAARLLYSKKCIIGKNYQRILCPSLIFMILLYSSVVAMPEWAGRTNLRGC